MSTTTTAPLSETVSAPARTWQVLGRMAQDYGHTWGGFDPLDPEWEAALIATGTDSLMTDYPKASQVDAAVRHRVGERPFMGWGITSPGVFERDGTVWFGHVTGSGRYGWDVREDEYGLVVAAQVSRPGGVVLEAEYAVFIRDPEDGLYYAAPHTNAGQPYEILVTGRVLRPDGGGEYHMRHCEYMASIVGPLVAYAAEAVKQWAEEYDATVVLPGTDYGAEAQREAYQYATCEFAARRISASARVEEAKQILADAEAALRAVDDEIVYLFETFSQTE